MLLKDTLSLVEKQISPKKTKTSITTSIIAPALALSETLSWSCTQEQEVVR
jgi:hypothetical protein